MALTWENSPIFKVSVDIEARELAKKLVAENTKELVEEVARELAGEQAIKTGKEVLTKTILTLLSKKLKINTLSDGVREKIDFAEIEALEKVRDNIFEIESLDEVVKYLESPN